MFSPLSGSCSIFTLLSFQQQQQQLENFFWNTLLKKKNIQNTLWKNTFKIYFFCFWKKSTLLMFHLPPFVFSTAATAWEEQESLQLGVQGQKQRLLPPLFYNIKFKRLFTPYFTISSLYETSSGHFLLVFVFSFNETINIRFEHYLIF